MMADKLVLGDVQVNAAQRTTRSVADA